MDEIKSWKRLFLDCEQEDRTIPRTESKIPFIGISSNRVFSQKTQLIPFPRGQNRSFPWLHPLPPPESAALLQWSIDGR